MALDRPFDINLKKVTMKIEIKHAAMEKGLMFKEKNIGRDILFALALIALVRHVTDHCSTPKINHDKTCTELIQELEPEEEKFLQQFRKIKCTILQQLETKIELGNYNDEQVKKYTSMIRCLRKELDIIYHDFFKLSPATVMLGPIGAVSRVMRERQLMNDFLKVSNRMGEIMYSLINTQTKSGTTIFKPAKTITESIENNQKLLVQL